MCSSLNNTKPEIEVFKSSLKELIVPTFENWMLRELIFYEIEYYFSIIFSGKSVTSFCVEIHLLISPRWNVIKC
jgi:hypothetical protein